MACPVQHPAPAHIAVAPDILEYHRRFSFDESARAKLSNFWRSAGSGSSYQSCSSSHASWASIPRSLLLRNASGGTPTADAMRSRSALLRAVPEDTRPASLMIANVEGCDGNAPTDAAAKIGVPSTISHSTFVRYPAARKALRN